jgi:hypothetical protein
MWLSVSVPRDFDGSGNRFLSAVVPLLERIVEPKSKLRKALNHSAHTGRREIEHAKGAFSPFGREGPSTSRFI